MQRVVTISWQTRQWPRDLSVFGPLCALWAAFLIFRMVARDPYGSPSETFEEVFFGVKFYGHAAHVTMTIQAVISAVFGIGILLHQRWGLILGQFYFVQVVISHVFFFVSYLGVPSQTIHVKITAIEGPIVFVILVYLWLRSRPLLVGE